MRTRKPPSGNEEIGSGDSPIPKYSVMVRWSDADSGFVATVPELLGVSAVGDTAEEAVREVGIAAEVCIESLRDMGRPVPESAQQEEFSGKLRLRMPRSLHRALANQAQQEGVSLNTHLLNLLRARAEEMSMRRYVEQLLQNAKAAAATPGVPQSMDYRLASPVRGSTSPARPLRVQEPDAEKRYSATRRKKGS